MTVSKTRAFRPMLMAVALLALSACSTTMANSPNPHSMKDGMSMSSCPCCAKMKEQSADKKAGCCSDMKDGKACGCCGGGDGKPMMCQPKN
jgi:hypothetical protein